MPIVYKIDVLDALKKKGYTTYSLEKVGLSATAIQKLRTNTLVGMSVLEKICELLECQPGDIIEYKE